MQPFLIIYCVSATLLAYLILLWFATVVRVCIGEKAFTYNFFRGKHMFRHYVIHCCLLKIYFIFNCGGIYLCVQVLVCAHTCTIGHLYW